MKISLTADERDALVIASRKVTDNIIHATTDIRTLHAAEQVDMFFRALRSATVVEISGLSLAPIEMSCPSLSAFNGRHQYMGRTDRCALCGVPLPARVNP